MKKLLFLLVIIPFFSFSQNTDPVNRKMLEYFKKQPVSTFEIRDFLKKSTQDIIEKTKDTVLIVEGLEYIIYLNKVNVASPKKINLSKASEKDLKKFSIDYDKFNKSSLYFFKRNRNDRVKLNLKVINDKAILALVVSYNAREWLFFNSVTFLIDDTKESIIFSKPEREVGTPYISEIGVNYVDDEIMNILEKIIQSKNIISMRYSGSKGFDDIELRSSEIENIRDVIIFYKSILE